MRILTTSPLYQKIRSFFLKISHTETTWKLRFLLLLPPKIANQKLKIFMSIAVLVLAEVLIVIGLSRLVGLAFRWINQPQVIGEIVSGIMLGPSLFGLIAPQLASALFPVDAIPFLEVLSNVG